MDFLEFNITFQNCHAIISGKIFFGHLFCVCTFYCQQQETARVHMTFSKLRSCRRHNPEKRNTVVIHQNFIRCATSGEVLVQNYSLYHDYLSGSFFVGFFICSTNICRQYLKLGNNGRPLCFYSLIILQFDAKQFEKLKAY